MKLIAIITPPSFLHRSKEIIPFEWESLESWEAHFKASLEAIDAAYAELQKQRDKFSAWCVAENKLNEVYLARSIRLKAYNHYCSSTPLKERGDMFREIKESFALAMKEYNAEIVKLKALQCDRPSDGVINEVAIGKQTICPSFVSDFKFLTLEDWFNKNTQCP